MFFFLKTFCCKCFLYVLKSFLSGLSVLCILKHARFKLPKIILPYLALRLWRRQPKLSRHIGVKASYNPNHIGFSMVGLGGDPTLDLCAARCSG